MCPPTYLPSLRDERSWVPASPPLDRGMAAEQWERLRDLVAEHLAPVVLLQAEPWAPAMTFTRDLALVTTEAIVPFMPNSVRGPFETPLAARQLAALDIDVTATDDPRRFDGGNVLADNHGRLLIGVTNPTPPDGFVMTVRALEAATGRPAYRVPLAGGRFPHIDMAVCDLNGRAWLVYPGALHDFDPADPDWIELFVGRPVIIAAPEDGERLACNVVVHEDVAIGPEVSVDLRRQIERYGIDYLPTPLSEPAKAGGGAHCLTLELPN